VQSRLTAPGRAASWSARWSVLQRRYAPYLFISPFFILFAVFGAYPILFSLYLSLHSWNPATGLAGMKFLGLENYSFTLTDKLFWESLYNTLYMGIASGLPQHLIAIPLAFALNVGFRRYQNLFAALYFLPFITSIVAIAMTFTVLFSWQYGLINQLILSLNGLPVLGALLPDGRVNWLGEANLIRPAISAVVVWRYFGWNTVIYLSGLQAIPRDYYEAASVDGATTWQGFRYITCPCCGRSSSSP
jgi:multiple sugar transport system permease protein